MDSFEYLKVSLIGLYNLISHPNLGNPSFRNCLFFPPHKLPCVSVSTVLLSHRGLESVIAYVSGITAFSGASNGMPFEVDVRNWATQRSDTKDFEKGLLSGYLTHTGKSWREKSQR